MRQTRTLYKEGNPIVLTTWTTREQCTRVSGMIIRVVWLTCSVLHSSFFGSIMYKGFFGTRQKISLKTFKTYRSYLCFSVPWCGSSGFLTRGTLARSYGFDDF